MPVTAARLTHIPWTDHVHRHSVAPWPPRIWPSCWRGPSEQSDSAEVCPKKPSRNWPDLTERTSAAWSAEVATRRSQLSKESRTRSVGHPGNSSGLSAAYPRRARSGEDPCIPENGGFSRVGTIRPARGPHLGGAAALCLAGLAPQAPRGLRARRGRARSRGAALVDALGPQHGCTRSRSVRSFPCGDRTAQSEGGRGWRDGRELDIPDPPRSGGQREPSRFVHGKPSRPARAVLTPSPADAARSDAASDAEWVSPDRMIAIGPLFLVAPAHRRCSTRR